MDRKSLFMLAGASGVLLTILLVAFSGGLSDTTLAKLKAEQSNYASDTSQFNSLKGLIAKNIASDSGLFTRKGPIWTQTISDLETSIPAGKAKLDEAAKLADLNDDKKRLEIEQKITEAYNVRLQFTRQAFEIHNNTKKLIDLKKNFDDYVLTIKHNYQAVKFSVNDDSLKSILDKAAIDWPLKKTDLNSRWSKLSAIRLESKTIHDNAQIEIEKTEKDYEAVLMAVNKLRNNRNLYVALKKDIKDRTGQLYRSWEKILTDMEIREGADVEFYHKYKVITITVKDKATRQSDTSNTEQVVKVPKTVYEIYKSNLGMAIESKSSGKYDDEADKTKKPQPAGYQYIASPGTSNQYGHWRTNHSGNSFWAFYGQYHFMQSMFWGSSYQPIYVTHYRDYRTSYNSGRSYYGRSTTTGRSRYGTSGTTTASKYRSSKYVKSGGYKTSKYVKSGGSYRGSKYAPKARSTSRSSGGWRSSGGRSGGRSRGGK